MELYWVITAAAVLGLLVGSFLNVVIYRLPIMMERGWKAEAREILAEECQCPPAPQHKVFNLVVPSSACPACDRKIRAWENIPVLSFLFMRGRCACKKNPISWRYPGVELLTAVVSGLVAWRYGATPQTLVCLGFVWTLVALAFIDADTMLLPDQMTLPLTWYAILATFMGYGLTDLRSSILGAVFGYLSLWLVYWAFKIITKKEGMGYGDFKFLAAIGALLGWQVLPIVILLSAVAGSVLGIATMIVNRTGGGLKIPFGPYLAVAGYIAILLGVVQSQRLILG
jgi:leader peptidase (prepilin peptidase) / N-methyltransferase